MPNPWEPPSRRLYADHPASIERLATQLAQCSSPCTPAGLHYKKPSSCETKGGSPPVATFARKPKATTHPKFTVKYKYIKKDSLPWAAVASVGSIWSAPKVLMLGLIPLVPETTNSTTDSARSHVIVLPSNQGLFSLSESCCSPACPDHFLTTTSTKRWRASAEEARGEGQKPKNWWTELESALLMPWSWSQDFLVSCQVEKWESHREKTSHAR